MTTEIIRISSQGLGRKEALAVTEKAGLDGGLDRKEILRLRLLAEELVGMLRGIVGDMEADYWLEQNDREFILHLGADINMTREMREQLLAVSTSGENAGAKGFMGKIREMIAAALLPRESRLLLSGLSVGLMSMASSSGPSAQQAVAEAFRWSMKEYKDTVSSELSESEAARAAWDELEKSIVASVADEVIVCVTGSHAEISIFKSF